MAGTQAQAPLSSTFRGYPVPRAGPDTGYVSKPGSNPTLRGIPLAIAGSACVRTFFFFTRNSYLSI